MSLFLLSSSYAAASCPRVRGDVTALATGEKSSVAPACAGISHRAPHYDRVRNWFPCARGDVADLVAMLCCPARSGDAVALRRRVIANGFPAGAGVPRCPHISFAGRSHQSCSAL